MWFWHLPGIESLEVVKRGAMREMAYRKAALGTVSTIVVEEQGERWCAGRPPSVP